VGAATLATVKGQGTTATAVVNERVRIEEIARTCEDEDGGERFLRDRAEAPMWVREPGGVRGGGRPYLRRRRCGEERDRRRRVGCAAAARWVRGGGGALRGIQP
jgi:hypothetical protein